jgi:hypothetical protein
MRPAATGPNPRSGSGSNRARGRGARGEAGEAVRAPSSVSGVSNSVRWVPAASRASWFGTRSTTAPRRRAERGIQTPTALLDSAGTARVISATNVPIPERDRARRGSRHVGATKARRLCAPSSASAPRGADGEQLELGAWARRPAAKAARSPRSSPRVVVRCEFDDCGGPGAHNAGTRTARCSGPPRSRRHAPRGERPESPRGRWRECTSCHDGLREAGEVERSPSSSRGVTNSARR